MQCLACNDALILENYGGLKIDRCPTCGGVWCDKGELTPIVNVLIKEQKIPANPEGSGRAGRQDTDTDDRLKNCPRCHETTESFNFAYDSNIFLNRCLSCEGVWLDGGELREVALFVRKHAFDAN